MDTGEVSLVVLTVGQHFPRSVFNVQLKVDVMWFKWKWC